MLNIRNYGNYEGRLAQEPRFFVTASGGETVILKVGCRRNYKPQGAEEAESDFAEFRAFLPKGSGRQIYQYLHTGDLVGIVYTLRTGSAEQADGKVTYYQSCQIEQIEVKEGRQVREERFAARNAAGSEPVPEATASSKKKK